MKFLKYLGWEVHLFRADLSCVPHFFAVANEVSACEMSGESLWEALQQMKKHLDKVEVMLADDEDFDAPIF